MNMHEERSKGEDLLKQVLEECLEEDLSFVPPDREIARTHRFSQIFEQAMQKLLDECAHRSRQEIRRHFSPRYGQWAACILVFCVCGWLFYVISGPAGSSDKEFAADTAEAPADLESAAEEAFDATADEGGQEAGAASGESVALPGSKNYCGRTVYLAEEQDVPEKHSEVTALVNCPVLDKDNPVMVLTIGNTGEDEIHYLNRYDLDVWLEDGWYRIPSESMEEGQWLTLEAGMAVDEEIDLSEYRIDYDARQYRLVTYVGQDMLSVIFTFEGAFTETMEEQE